MKKKCKIFRIIKWIAVVILSLLTVFFLVRAIGKAIYNQTPAGGINESMYIDVNGTKQWIMQQFQWQKCMVFKEELSKLR